MPETDLDLLKEAATDAGRIALDYRARDPEVWEKPGGQGPVTEADLAIDRMLRGELGAARPDYGWLSEESAGSGDRLAAERVFIVDPIDGTRDFLGGGRSFAHALAVAERGRIHAAIVFLPCREKLYAAALGAGTTLNERPVSVSDCDALEHAHVLARRSHLEPDRWPGGVPPVSRQYRPALAYRLALVAEGRFDAMLTLRGAWEWDIAAGMLLVAEAGGAVTDRTGAALAFNGPTARLAGVVAGAPKIHEALRARLA